MNNDKRNIFNVDRTYHSVLRTASQLASQGVKKFDPPPVPETSQPIVTKTCVGDYVGYIHSYAEFHLVTACLNFRTSRFTGQHSNFYCCKGLT